MSPDSPEKIKAEPLALLGRVVTVDAAEIAEGKVGADGSASASASTPTNPCTGLLYSRIQSGRTVAMIALFAAALDDGFGAVVVLTSGNRKLVAQAAT